MKHTRTLVALPLLVSAVATALMLAPLFADFAHRAANLAGDASEYIFRIWWFNQALFREGVSPFYHPRIFYPYGYALGRSETTLANLTLATPLALLAGEIIAYNSLLVASCVLSGFGMYLLVYRLTREPVAGLLAGLAFAFAPTHLAHLAMGMIGIASVQWLPFAFLGVESMLERRDVRSAILTGVFYAFAALSAWYMAFIVGIGLVSYFLFRLWAQRRRWDRTLVILVGLFAIVVIVLVSPALVMAWRTHSEMTRSISVADHWGTTFLDFVYPNPRHPLWGSFFLARYDALTRRGDAYLGLPVLLLAIAGWCLGRRREMWPYLAVAFLGGILSLGLTLHMANGRLYIPVPQAIERVFTAGMGILSRDLALNATATYWTLRVPGQIYIPLPAMLVYLFFPGGNGMRFWHRFALLTVFGVCVLAAVGLVYVLRRVESRRWRLLITVLCLGIVLFDFAWAPGMWGVQSLAPHPAVVWLAEQPGDFAIMKMPVEVALCGPSLYELVTHGKNMAYGYGAFFPPEWEMRRWALERFPEEVCLEVLRAWGVRYILFYPGEYPALGLGPTPDLSAVAGLRLVRSFGDVEVWELVAQQVDS
ncbi:MAG: hypothetical protein H5T64_04600 [Chloroflexi bacterium]|nr:hypothetical protein [Chloroflexota bacterium]